VEEELNRVKIRRLSTAYHPRSATCLCLQRPMHI